MKIYSVTYIDMLLPRVSSALPQNPSLLLYPVEWCFYGLTLLYVTALNLFIVKCFLVEIVTLSFPALSYYHFCRVYILYFELHKKEYVDASL